MDSELHFLQQFQNNPNISSTLEWWNIFLNRLQSVFPPTKYAFICNPTPTIFSKEQMSLFTDFVLIICFLKRTPFPISQLVIEHCIKQECFPKFKRLQYNNKNWKMDCNAFVEALYETFDSEEENMYITILQKEHEFIFHKNKALKKKKKKK
jgi:hypothetical protein